MSYDVFTKVAAPSTPAANKVVFWFDSTNLRWSMMDENGVVYGIGEYNNKINYLLNGGFDLAQRQAPGTLTTYSNTSGRTYGADRWGMTNENASIQYQRIDTSAANESGLQARMYGKFKKITSTGKIVVTQVIENSQMMQLRGRTVRISCKMKFSVAGSMTVRLGLLQLQAAGTVDTIPATFVSAFGANGTDPTFGTSVAKINPTTAENGTISSSAISCTLTTGWVRYSGVFTVPTDAKNLIFAVWGNSQLAANDELNISEVGVYDGADFMDWTPRPIAEEIDLCQRYYVKTFQIDTAPAQNAGVTTGALVCIVGIAGATALADVFYWRMPFEMFKVPTITLYNPGVANAQARRTTGAAAADQTATATKDITTNSVSITATGDAAGVVGNQVIVHVSAEAEL